MKLSNIFSSPNYYYYTSIPLETRMKAKPVNTGVVIIITKLENILLVPTKLQILQPHENQHPHANKFITVNITHSINYYFQ